MKIPKIPQKPGFGLRRVKWCSEDEKNDEKKKKKTKIKCSNAPVIGYKF